MVGALKGASNRSKGAGQLMIAIVLIGLAAGCASALMFASIISGALISLVLFYLAPLPLMVAAMGWGPIAATIGGIAAASGLGAIFGLPYCVAFALTVALPAWWLGHLALLGRPVSSTAPATGPVPAAPTMEWYPVGRILLWIAGFAVLTTIAAMLTLGTDAETITGTLRRGLLRILGPREPEDRIFNIGVGKHGLRPDAATVIGNDASRNFSSIAFLDENFFHEHFFAHLHAIFFQLGNHLLDQQIRAAAKRVYA